MPVRVVCPTCRTSYTLADSCIGKTVQCKQCNQVFGVGAPRGGQTPPPVEEPLDVLPVDEPEPAPAPKKAAPAPKKAARPAPARAGKSVPVLEEVLPADDPAPGGDFDGLADDALQTEPVPRKKAVGLPASRKTSPAPSGKSSSTRRPGSRGRAPAGSRMPLILVGVGVGVLLLVGGIVLAVVLMNDKPGTDGNTNTQVAQNQNPKPNPNNPKNPNNNVPPEVKPPDPIVKNLPDPGPMKDPNPNPMKDPGPMKDPNPNPMKDPEPMKDPGPNPMKDPEPMKEPVVGPPLGPNDLKPPVLAQDKVVKPLPAPAEGAVVGGGGRYVILHLSSQRKLAVFDVSEAKIARYVPVAGDNIKFAAGQDKLLVVLPDNNIIQRWDLPTGTRELSVPLQGGDAIKAVAMGSASQGPLWTNTGLIDVKTLKPLEVEKEANGLGVGPGDMLRASADGTVLGYWSPDTSPQGIRMLVLHGKTLKQYGQHDSAGHIIPGPDGKVIYTARGLFTNQAKRLGDARQADYSLPAVQGDYYLTLSQPGPGRPRQNRPGGSLSVHLVGDARPLLTLNDVELPRDINQWDREKFGNDQRILFIPAAKVIITIPETNDKLVLHRFDIDQALEKSGIDYLLVLSRPPATALKGGAFSYQVAVKSRKGGVKCKLDSGPMGMTTTQAGLVKWTVPANPAEPEVDVILSVSDSSGQEVFHTFKLAVSDKKEPGDNPVVVKDPMPMKDPDPVPMKDPDPMPMKDPVAGPPAGPNDLRPPALEQDKVVKALPSPAEQMVVGGGGRYLVLHLPQQRKLGIFDVSEAKMAHYVPVAADNVKIAAGQDKLMVYLPDTNVLQRWNLHTGERELSVPLVVRDRHKAMAMGSASHGPLFLGGLFLDIRTLKPMTLRLQNPGNPPMVGDYVRASADGKVFGTWRAGTSPSGIQTFVIEGNLLKSYYEHDSAGHVVPGPDGNVIYTARGLYTNQVKRRGEAPKGAGLFSLPSVQGDFYLTLPEVGPVPRPGNRPGSLSVHLGGDARPLVTLNDVDLPKNINQFAAEPFGTDQRILLIPAARVIVTIPETNDKLVLHRFDVEKALEKSGIDYLIVTSQAPARAPKGGTYTYQMVIKSKKGGVKCKLDSGPPGMTVTPAGLVKWNVPANPSGNQVDVIVNVMDSTGQEVFHNFKLAFVKSVPAEHPPKKDPDPKALENQKKEVEPRP